MFGIIKFATVLLTLVLVAHFSNGAPTGDSLVAKAIDVSAPAGNKNEVAANVEPKEYLEEEQKAAASVENLMEVRMQPNQDETETQAPDDGGAKVTKKPANAAPNSFKPEFFVIVLSALIVKCFAQA